MTIKSEISINSLQSRVELQLIYVRDLLEKNKDKELKLIVAVSGGEDSVSLLDVLYKQKEKFKLCLVVAHFDHGLRENSGEDLEFVKKIAENYQLEFVSKRAEPKSQNENLEAWARNVRYQFLEEVRNKENADLILTAHHQQDQAETFLMRLLSLRMLTSSKAIHAFDEKRKIFRPFLEIEKEAILEYVRFYDLRSVFDQSNLDLQRTRNRIRRDLLPKLQSEYNPNIVSGLCQLEKRLLNDEDFLLEQAKVMFHNFENSRKISKLLELPIALQWRLLSLIAELDLGNRGVVPSYSEMLQALELLKQFQESHGESKKISLKSGVEFFVETKNYFAFRSEDNLQNEFFSKTQLLVPGELKKELNHNCSFLISSQIIEEQKLDNRNIEWIRNATADNTHDFAVEFFDLDQLKNHFVLQNDFSLMVRPRKDGDSIRVWKRGTRKLKKLLLEKGLRLTLRSCIPIVEYSDKIIWVPGVARSEIAPVTEKTKLILELKYKRSHC